MGAPPTYYSDVDSGNLRHHLHRGHGNPAYGDGGSEQADGHFVAESAIDGNTAQDSTQDSMSSCTHRSTADTTAGGWWTMTLDESKGIHNVEVWNRADCSSSRLSGVEVYAGSHLCGTLGSMCRRWTAPEPAPLRSSFINLAPPTSLRARSRHMLKLTTE